MRKVTRQNEKTLNEARDNDSDDNERQNANYLADDATNLVHLVSASRMSI